MSSFHTVFDVYAGGSVYWPWSGSQPVYAVKRIVTDIKEATRTPNYRAIIKSGGKLPPQPYYRSNTIINRPFGSVTRYNAWGIEYDAQGVGAQWAGWHGRRPPAHDEQLLDAVSRADRLARNKALLKIKDQKVNLVQAAAERKQTTRLIATAVTNLNTSYRHLRKGDLVSAGRVWGLTIGKRAATRYRAHHGRVKSSEDIDQMMASGVLQIQYGIKPLLSDIVGSYDLILDKHTVPVTETVRSTGKCSVDLGWTSSSEGIISSRAGSIDVTVSYGITYAAENVLLQTTGQVGLTNPLLIAWELMPWSFVIDWIIPIGNAISAIDATVGMQFISGWRSEKVKVDFVNSNTASSEIWRISVTEGLQQEYFRRTLAGAFPSPAMPQFKNPLSVDHLINGLALLAGFKTTVYGKR